MPRFITHTVASFFVSMRNTKDYHMPLYYHILIENFTLTSPTVNSDITSISVVIKYMFPMT
ncbi:hypothetical protein LBGG_02325 [Lactobacillus gasseri MV-22]|nr:hypothetical protein LBGG_02325 [Lactobacillus gasseri MV-22]